MSNSRRICTICIYRGIYEPKPCLANATLKIEFCTLFLKKETVYLLVLVTSHLIKIADGNPKLEWNLAFSFSTRLETSFPLSSEKSTIVTNIPFSPRAKLRALPAYSKAAFYQTNN